MMHRAHRAPGHTRNSPATPSSGAGADPLSVSHMGEFVILSVLLQQQL